MSPEEIKKAMASQQMGEDQSKVEEYTCKQDRMEMQFKAMQRVGGNREMEEFKTMQEYMDTLFQKYQDNIVLLVSN